MSKQIQKTKMTETKGWAIGLVVACTAFTAAGSLLMKKGADAFSFNITGILNAYPIAIGLVSYFLGFLILVYALKHGELSVLYPFVSLSFVWVALLSYSVLGEKMTMLEITGVIAIVCGVVLTGIASRNAKAARG